MNVINAILISLLLVLSAYVFAESLEEKCNSNDFSACAEMGRNYDNGWSGYHKNNHKTYKFYKKGRQGNDAWSCENLGVFYESGLGVRKNPQKADENYEKACIELKRSRWCELLARAYAYDHNSVPKNHKKALILFKEAYKLYNGIAPDYFSLGVLYQEGENKF